MDVWLLFIMQLKLEFIWSDVLGNRLHINQLVNARFTDNVHHMTTLSYIYSTQKQTSDRHKFVIENVESISTKRSKQSQHPIRI